MLHGAEVRGEADARIGGIGYPQPHPQSDEEEQAVFYYEQAAEAGGGVLGFEYADSGAQLAQWRLRALR